MTPEERAEVFKDAHRICEKKMNKDVIVKSKPLGFLFTGTSQKNAGFQKKFMLTLAIFLKQNTSVIYELESL